MSFFKSMKVFNNMLFQGCFNTGMIFEDGLYLERIKRVANAWECQDQCAVSESCNFFEYNMQFNFCDLYAQEPPLEQEEPSLYTFENPNMEKKTKISGPKSCDREKCKAFGPI